MTTAPKKIFIIDDNKTDSHESVYSRLFPNAVIRGFGHVTPALAEMAETTDGIYPDLLILDATIGGHYTRWGAENAVSVLSWLKENAPNVSMPYVIFHSADAEFANQSLRAANREIRKLDIQAETIAAIKDEIYLINEFLIPSRTPELKASHTTTLREFLNRVYEFDFPITTDDFDKVLMAREKIAPEEVVRLVDTDKMSREEALDRLADEAITSAKRAHMAEVRYMGEDFELNELQSLQFNRGTGQPVVGPVAFNGANVVTQAQEGKKPILVVKSVTPDIVPLFKYVAAIVVLSNKGSGHLEVLVEAHRIPALLGRDTEYWREKPRPSVRLHAPDSDVTGSKSYLAVHKISDPSKYNAGTLLSRGVEEIKYAYSLNAQTSDDDTNERGSRNLYKVKMLIRSGQEVTVNPGSLKLHLVPLGIWGSNSRHYSWLNDVSRWLDSWHTENGVKLQKFKGNVDVLDQMYGLIGDDGIGLVRTEHLVISSPEVLSAFRSIVLKKENAQAGIFEELSMKDFEQILHRMCTFDETWYPTRIRLLDAPPSEFFDEADQTRFEALYGDKNLRGVQLAKYLPQLYEVQIKAVFGAYMELQKKAKEDDFNSPPSGPVEIMIPTTRTAEELAFAKNMVEQIALDMGFPSEYYRFGSMLETIAACQNIKEIAPLCDFISIGSNDLTAEILDCDRDDWTKRHNLTLASGTNSDPFITIHSQVLSQIYQAVADARTVKPNLQIDLCGAHASDLASLVAFHPLELDGFSMPPSSENHEALPLLYKYEIFNLSRPAQAVGRVPKLSDDELSPTG